MVMDQSQEFEEGQQVDGLFKCLCGADARRHDDLSYCCYKIKPQSYDDKRSLVTKHPFANLPVKEIREDLEKRWRYLWKADDVNSESEWNDTSHDASALDEPFDETSSDLSDISDDEESDDVTSKVSKNISTGLKCQQEYAEILRLDRDKLRELQSADPTLANVREHADANQLSEIKLDFSGMRNYCIHKLSAQWQGPLTVVRKVSNVDYEIERGGRRKPKRVYHINMLRAWKERNKPVYFVDTVDAVCNKDIENSMYYTPEDQSTETWRDVVIADSVTADQHAELLRLLQEYSDVLTDVPGCTDQVEHNVITTDETPICQKPYPLPQAAKQTVKEELQKMLKAGIITESKSPYASPLVLVKKKQSGIRFCVDYRGLNQVTVSDAYPMPRPDELIEEIGGSNYISTIDLTKGYWQIPLSKRAREKSAFITPFGLYEFTVMPFGMKNAPATFQRLMDKTFNQPREKAYMDDLGPHDHSWEDYVKHLRSIFERLCSCN
ncbi:uncharacterized protein [Ptychodera flava]|uniref:uncharacterized protein n=1 Tax=Ptychodera flava TaxID=63121 RepID=UPI003969FB7B